MVHQITRISIRQTSKVVAVMYGIFGFVYTPFLLFSEVESPPEEQIGLWIWILLPVMLAAFMYLATAVSCAIYNGVAKRVGGIEFTMDSTEDIHLQQ